MAIRNHALFVSISEIFAECFVLVQYSPEILSQKGEDHFDTEGLPQSALIGTATI